MKLFISSKEWFDDYVDAKLRCTIGSYNSLDCEHYYLEAVSKKLPASMIELRKKEMTESKEWLKNYRNIIVKMRKMNFIQRLLYKRGK